VNLHFLLPPTLGLPRTSALAELLEASLQGRWGHRVRVEVARSYRDLERAVLGGSVDLAWAPPVLCGRAEPTARLILQAIRGGRSTYRAALIGRRSDHLGLDHLAGRRVAWVDPYSAGGYLLPRALLRSRGLDPDGTFGSQRFAGSYRDALVALVSGKADVAPIFAGDGDEGVLRVILADQIGPEARLLAPFALTQEAPTDGLVATARLDPTAAREVAELLLPGDGSPPPGLLEVCEAEGFAVAAPGLYGSFVSTVSPPDLE
jgi:ABC-type phosphate/phosphonate transport system substrate-binding protein